MKSRFEMSFITQSCVSLSFFALIVLSGCRKQGALTAEHDPRQYRETEMRLEACQTEGAEVEEADADGDGKGEILRVLEAGREVCRIADLNFDGEPERVTFFDEQGKVRRVQSDYDREGKVDEIALYEGGVLVQKQRMTSANGQLDTWEYYEAGRLVLAERDENGDGIVDQWWEYSDQGCPVVHVDANLDGRADPGGSIDYCPQDDSGVPDENPVAEEDRSESTSPSEDVELKEEGSIDEESAPELEQPPLSTEKGSNSGDMQKKKGPASEIEHDEVPEKLSQSSREADAELESEMSNQASEMDSSSPAANDSEIGAER